MRVVAVCAIVVFVAWVSEQALDRPATIDAGIAEARYFVASPVPTTTAVPTPTGDVPQSTSTAPAASRVDGPAVVVATPERGTAQQVTPTVPPPQPVGWNGLPLAPGELDSCGEARFYRTQFGLPERFDGIAWRESRCQPDARNWCCSGTWQIHKLWIPKLAHCGVFVRDDLYDGQRNACAAAYVLAVQGINAWSTA